MLYFSTKALDNKENEVEEAKQRAVSSKTIGLERQVEIWKEKLNSKENELHSLEEKYICILQNEQNHQQDLTRLTTRTIELENRLNRPKNEGSCQTEHGHLYETSENLIDKMNQVLEHIVQQENTEHLTLSQLESTLKSSIALHNSHTTPTAPTLKKSREQEVENNKSQQIQQHVHRAVQTEVKKSPSSSNTKTLEDTFDFTVK